jgi:transposase-like protein
MPRKIDSKTKVLAVKDYLTSGGTLREVSGRHGISTETLRRFLDGKVRKRGSSVAVHVKKSRIVCPNASRRWKISEDEILRDAILGNFTVAETMDLLGRSRSSITSRKHILLTNGFIDEKRFKRGLGDANEIEFSGIPASVAESAPEVEMKSPSLDLDIKRMAELVKEFGVSVHMTVTPDRTEIKIQS